MKLTKTSVIGMVAAILALAICMTAPRAKFAIADLAGTKWFNNEYPPSSGWDRAEITTDGIMKMYSSVVSGNPWTEKYTITESWHDRNGDLWFKNTWDEAGTGGKYFVLNKISKSGAVWEFCVSGSGYPAELSPLEGDYTIYYRE